MQRSIPVVLALIPILASACDIEDETSTRVGEGYVGAGLESDFAVEDDALDDLDELTDAIDPSLTAYCDGVVTWPASFGTFEAQVITLINKKRASGANCGGVWRRPVPALVKHDKLRCAARRHSRDMGANEFTSHTGSNGTSPWTRLKAAGYAYSWAAENIAWGYATPETVVAGWMKSTAHCNNIMSAKATRVGVGYYKSATSWKHYWTQDFAAPL